MKIKTMLKIPLMDNGGDDNGDDGNDSGDDGDDDVEDPVDDNGDDDPADDNGGNDSGDDGNDDVDDPIGGDDDDEEPGDVTSVFETEDIDINANVTVAPNPIIRSAQLTVDLKDFDRSHVRLEVVNALGQVVAVIYDQIWAPDFLTLTWEAVDATGQPLPSGHYFLLVTTGDQRSTVHLNIVR